MRTHRLGKTNVSFLTKDVFGGLICWSHTYRNVRPKLATIWKELGELILSDSESI